MQTVTISESTSESARALSLSHLPNTTIRTSPLTRSVSSFNMTSNVSISVLKRSLGHTTDNHSIVEMGNNNTSLSSLDIDISEQENKRRRISAESNYSSYIHSSGSTVPVSPSSDHDHEDNYMNSVAHSGLRENERLNRSFSVLHNLHQCDSNIPSLSTLSSASTSLVSSAVQSCAASPWNQYSDRYANSIEIVVKHSSVGEAKPASTLQFNGVPSSSCKDQLSATSVGNFG